jgi:hypothetical protein
MSFNPKKCNVMSFGKYFYYKRNYIIEGHLLSRVSEFTDLGLLVCDNLHWEKHIKSCINKANKRFGYVKRCIGFGCSKEVKLTCYKALIRPLLEYCTIVWFCDNKRILGKVEAVQRRVTKFILNDYQSDYKTRLISCSLQPLALRRQFLDCVFAYNSLNDLNDFVITDKIELVNDQLGVYTRLRQNQDELMFKHGRTNGDLFKKFYTRRITDVWNELPYEIRNMELTDSGKNSSFKRELKAWFTNYFMESFSDNMCTWIINCKCRGCRIT